MFGTFPLVVTNTSETKMIETFGKYSRQTQPGLSFLIPFVQRVAHTVSTRKAIIDIKASRMITSDNANIEVDGIVYYQVVDPYKAIYAIDDYKKAIEYITVTNLRSLIGELSLNSVLSERSLINEKLLSVVDDLTVSFGVKIISTEIKEVTPPDSILKSMEAEINAERNRIATVLKATGEKDATVKAAEAHKTSTILNAEASKEETLRLAEAEAEAKRLAAEAEADYISKIAQAQADALALMNKAILDSGQDAAALIALKQTEMMLEMSKNPANKLIIPSESISSLGSLSAISEILKSNK